MIQTIEIIVRNGLNQTINALIVYDKRICYMNNQKYEVTDSFLEEIIQTICLWKNEYGFDGNIDSEEFLVKVTSTEGKESFHGKGVFPYNYVYLKELLGDLDD